MGIGGDYSSSQLDACLHVCYISQLFKPLRGKQRERAGVERLGTPASVFFLPCATGIQLFTYTLKVKLYIYMAK